MRIASKLLDLNMLSSVWNITRTIFGIDNYKIIDDSVIKVYYPSGSSTPSKTPVGGVGFYLTPNEISNATDVTLSYSVKFGKTFQPVLGGKLPGLFINNNSLLHGFYFSKFSKFIILVWIFILILSSSVTIIAYKELLV